MDIFYATMEDLCAEEDVEAFTWMKGFHQKALKVWLRQLKQRQFPDEIPCAFADCE